MSNSILVSLQNISSSLKSVNDVVKADNFYDTIYCGKYYDRFSVKCGGVMSYMYVIKLKNAQMSRFMSAVDKVSLYGDSPFVKCKVYRDELLCYEGKNAGVYYDIVIVENTNNTLLTQYLSQNKNTVPGSGIINVVKSFTLSVLWAIHYRIYINDLCNKSVVISQNRVRFSVNERIRIDDLDEIEPQFQEIYCKKLMFAVFASWMLMLRAEKNYKTTDLLLDYLESYDFKKINDSCLELADEIDIAFKSDFKSIVDYVLKERGDLHSAVGHLKNLSKISDDKIDQWCSDLSCSNHYFNSDKYDISYGASENRVIVRDKKRNKYGYINNYGDSVIDCKYDEVTHFSEGIAVVGIGKKYFAIDNNGARLMDESFDAIQWYSDVNRFIVHNNGCYSLLGRVGEVVSKHEYGWIGEFSFNRSVVESISDGRKGYIDLDGNEITPILYDDALSFVNGVGKVLFEGEWRTVIFDGDVV